LTKTVILVGERQREYAHKLLAQAALGEVVTIAPPKKSREQEKHYWALCGDFAKQATFNGVKLDDNSWMALFLDALFAGEGKTIVPSLDGQRFVQLNRSTKRLKKHEASALIEMIYAEGHHRGVVFPDYKYADEP
jgi:hypothetical protein